MLRKVSMNVIFSFILSVSATLLYNTYWLFMVGRAIVDSLTFSESDSYCQATVKTQFPVKMEIFSPKIVSERESQTCGRFMYVHRPVDRK